jgi:hypothetical protein
MAFVLLALAAGVAVAHVARCPADQPATTARAEINALLRPRVLVAIATTFLATIGGYATYTFIAPILTDETGFAHDHLWLLLLLFGLGSLAGSVLGGRLADFHLDRGLRIGSAVLALTTLLFGLSLHSKVFTAILLFVLGVAFFLIVPALNARVVVGHGGSGTDTGDERQRGRLQPQHHGGRRRRPPRRGGWDRPAGAGAAVGLEPGRGASAHSGGHEPLGTCSRGTLTCWFSQLKEVISEPSSPDRAGARTSSKLRASVREQVTAGASGVVSGEVRIPPAPQTGVSQHWSM